MSYYFCIKPIGQTMNELINQEKQKENNSKISFAGRLDPMAYGSVLILKDELRKRQDEFITCKKEYTIKMVLGFSSDTLDILSSRIKYSTTNISLSNITDIISKIKNIITNNFIGEQKQNFPIFSSKTIMKDGKMTPMWMIYKENPSFFNNIKLPSKTINVYDFEILNYELIEKKIFVNSVIDDLEKVSDNNTGLTKHEALNFFRNVNILEKEVCILNLKIVGSSGTYIRQLVSDISKKLKIPAISWRICRTNIIV